MDDLGEKLNAILNDPGQMEKLAGMARSIMGGEPGRERQPSGGGEPGLDPAMLGRIAGMLQKSGKSEKRALLEAMKPYLSQKRRDKMDRAIKLAGFASIAEAALGELGEKKDV